ncbi:MAG: rod shape-determining protein [Oscillospiraceae bacterium]|nr:rod shape-determining protein [Oscillospiraceae bacterium]
MSTPDIGIDLGTANIVMTYGKKGVVLSEPSVIAYNTSTQRILAVGQEAYQMIGKTPAYIDVVHPMADGVISDDLLTQCMLREFLQKVCGSQLVKPRIIICVPAFITELEKRAVADCVMAAGCRKAYLIDEPIAAMLGAGINIGRAKGHMVVDIGGGTTDVAIVSMNGIVTSHSIKIAGNRIDKAIQKYMMNHYKLLIGEQTAEQVKKTLTNLYDPRDDVTMIVKGRSVMRGLPDAVEINEMELFDAMEDEVFAIMEGIKKVLEETPPELVGDIYENGILLTGGGSLLGGLRELIHRTLNVNCVLAKDAVHCVAKGTGLAFQKINNLLDGFEGVTVYKYQ